MKKEEFATHSDIYPAYAGMFHAFQLINKAHVVMLIEEAIITKGDGAKILGALLEIDKEGENLKLDPYLEDIYMNIEQQIIERIGEDSGGKMHTGRSRNDLYACAYRIILRDKLLKIMQEINKIRESLLNRASEHYDTVMPGFTHTQPAQPTTLGHYFLATGDSIEEDFSRIKDAYKRTNLNPLGAAAFAGTGFPISRLRTTELLAFDGIVENSLKSVSDYSYMAEALSSLAILMGNISRFAGDLITWSTPAFGMVELDQSFVGISSIMPQKRNPVTAEFIRSITGEVNGSLIKALTIIKGIPSGFNMDLLYLGGCLGVFEVVHSCMRLLNGIISTLVVHKDAMEKRATDGFSISTELADTLVREKGISFRTAHRIVAAAVRMAHEQGQDNITTDMINQASKKVIGQTIGLKREKMSVSIPQILRIRKSNGGASPIEVQRMIKSRQAGLNKENLWVKQEIDIIKNSKVKLTRAVINSDA